MTLGRFTALDSVVALAVCGIIAVVIYRYRVQQHFDLYGLLVMSTMVAGYLAYRQNPPRKKDVDSEEETSIANEKKG